MPSLDSALAQALLETLFMVFFSGLLSLALGLLLGTLLFLLQPNQALAHATAYRMLSLLTNIGRSFPFIILLIAISPLTRALLGTTIGTTAALMPLTLSAIPFFARLVESAFVALPTGLFETAHALGASTWQLITRFMLPEGAPQLVKGATLTLINLLGYSAMAGAIGGGGLGQLAINEGYQRFNTSVMIQTVLLLILLVQLIQWLGDWIAHRRAFKSTAVVLALGLLLYGAGSLRPTPVAAHALPTLRIGVTNPTDRDLLQHANQIAQAQYQFKIIPVLFDDYVQPNIALNNGSIDANIFQHQPYLDAQKKAHPLDITPIARTFLYPFGFYAAHIQTIQALPVNARVAIPNDPSNGGRALWLLAHAQLITLKKGTGRLATLRDITSNPKHLHLIAVDAAQIPHLMQEVDLAGLTNDYAHVLGLLPKQALLLEDKQSPYANLIVVRTAQKDRPLFKQLIDVIHSPAYQAATAAAYPGGAALPAF
jgi:D-methionine transport system substrate-binding protein